MRLITWNIRQGGGRRIGSIASALSQRAPDIVVLTEFRNNAAGTTIRRELGAIGLVHQSIACQEALRNSVLVASREPFTSELPLSSLPGYEHRCIEARFESFELLAFYFPLDDAKGPLFEWILARDSSRLSRPVLLIGDFNTGRHRVDENGATFRHADKLDALAAIGWRDSWRDRHPHAREFSWFSNVSNGFRIDHVWATLAMDARIGAVEYSHVERESGASDHSMLDVEFDRAIARD